MLYNLKNRKEFESRCHDMWAEAGGTASRISMKQIKMFILEQMKQEEGYTKDE